MVESSATAQGPHEQLPGALERLFSCDGRKASYNADFLEALACHPFALNFTELDAISRRLARGDARLEIGDLPAWVRAELVEARGIAATDLNPERLREALMRHRGNVRRVGQELGVPRSQLYRVLAGFGLNPDAYRERESPVAPSAPWDEWRPVQ